MQAVATTADDKPLPDGRVLIRRHSLLVRITHWINVVCILFLLMSGLQIFNATPALYLGQKADFDHPVMSLTANNTPAGPIGDDAGDGAGDPESLRLEPAVAALERRIVLRALQTSGDNKVEAACLLGVSERTLWYKLKKYRL